MQQRSAQANSQVTSNGLFGHSKETGKQHLAAGENSGQTAELSAHLKQLEQNKRKYIVQPAKSPTLSAQKANLIKAKLGLIVTQPTNSSAAAAAKSSSSLLVGDLTNIGGQSKAAYLQQQQQQATNIIAVAKTEAKMLLDNDLNAKTDQVPMAGAAQMSTIPKTDFECTDSKGRFVSGLFADHKTGCQVWHLCSNNRKYSFLCPSGTIFSAKLRICDWKYNVKCENSLPH